MSLRAKILAYLIAIHAILGGLAFWALRDTPWMLLVAELAFVLSALIGYRLMRSFFVPLELIRTGAELMRERDFTSHFLAVGQTEMDALVAIYNRMIDELRGERRRLEEQNLFLDRVLEASPTAVVTLDHDGRISQLNPSALRLNEPGGESMVGQSVEAFAPPIGRVLIELEDGGSAVVAIHGGRRVKCRRGTFYDRGFARRFFLIEELTEELRASEKAAYGKLIRMMSHEVNNTVGSVRSLLESCQSYGTQLREADRDDYDQATTVASDRLAHLDTFMSALAQVVRVPPPDRRPCDVRRLLDDIAILMQPEMEQRSIELDWQPADGFPEVSLDKNQIEQVLVNVLRNAMESIDRDGRIAIRLTADDGRPYLSVRDDGPGISPQMEPHLFTPFFSTKREGRGVGLTLIREVLSQHDLDFDLRNVTPRGAEFRVYL